MSGAREGGGTGGAGRSRRTEGQDASGSYHPPALEGPGHGVVPIDGPPGAAAVASGQSQTGVTQRDFQTGSGRISRHGSQLPAGDRGHGSRGSGMSRRDISPMPSERSISSTNAQVGPRRGGERARISTPAGRGSPLENDSEDEEAHDSDDDISVLEGEARSSRGGTAATTPSPPSAHGSRGPAGEGRSSGLRGGGGGSEGIIEIGDYDLEETDEEENVADGKEYNEHEDFDDEYRTSGARKSEQQVNDEMTTVDAESSIAQENLQATDNRKGKDKEEEPHEEPPEKLHQQPQEDMEEAPYESFRSRERRPYVVTEGMPAAENIIHQPYGMFSNRTPRPYVLPKVGETTRVHCTEVPGSPGPSQQRKGDAAGKAGQEQEQESNRGQMPGLFPDSDFDESDAKPKGNPRPYARARDDTRTYDDRKPRQARAGAAPESHFGYNRAGGAGQAKPSAKQRFNNEREAHRFPGKGFDFYDDYDEEDDPRGARAFHERMRRGPKFGPNPSFGRGFPRFHQPRPKTHKYANNQHRERQGGQHGNQFGGAPYVNKGTRRAAEDQRHWRRDTPRYSKDDSESFDTSDSTEDSSTSEESSDAGFLPKRKPQGKKAPPRSFADEYSSDSDRPAPRRRPKAGAGKSRARAESPPRRPSNRPNEGRRRANARGPPPPRYADVMKD
ncbi:MAG: hypothetical protein Q9224_006145, partial [Gallowayella concinna]